MKLPHHTALTAQIPQVSQCVRVAIVTRSINECAPFQFTKTHVSGGIPLYMADPDELKFQDAFPYQDHPKEKHL